MVKTEFTFLRWFTSSATAKLYGSNGGVAALLQHAGEGEGGEMEWQSACGGQQGALHFKPASVRHGRGEQGAWRPCGDDGLTPVGHCRLKFLIQ